MVSGLHESGGAHFVFVPFPGQAFRDVFVAVRDSKLVGDDRNCLSWWRHRC